MNHSVYRIILLAGFILPLSQCSKTDLFTSASVNDYYPLQVGKYYIYKLDSSLYVSFGQVKEVRSNIIKEIIDAPISDNLGRPSFRVKRLIRHAIDSTQWVEHSTYIVTPLAKSLELIEDNLRFIKLQLPVKEFFSWNGNRYLPDEAFPQFGFNSTAHSDLGSWEYNYVNIDSSAVINSRIFKNTITVTCSITDSTNFPPADKNAPSFKTIWEEKYAKGIGLISRVINLEEFQPRSTTYPNGYFTGFGVKQVLIEHN